MKNISLKLSKEIAAEVELILKRKNQSRNSYINDAIKFYNDYLIKRQLKEDLERESQLVSADSMEVLKEFEAIE